MLQYSKSKNYMNKAPRDQMISCYGFEKLYCGNTIPKHLKIGFRKGEQWKSKKSEIDWRNHASRHQILAVVPPEQIKPSENNIRNKEMLYKCKDCPEKFTKQHDLKLHTRVHSGVKPYSCKFKDCGEKFIMPLDLKFHISIAHTKKPLVFCEICDKPFSEPEHLQAHMFRCHTDKPYKCDKCDIKFALLRSFEKHNSKNHTDK